MTDTSTLERTTPSVAATVRPLGERSRLGGDLRVQGPVFDPARGVIARQVRFASADDVGTAVQAAAAAGCRVAQRQHSPSGSR